MNMDYIKYITDGIEDICKNHKRRSAGFESVKTAQAQMAESMKDYVDEIRTQQFEIHPRAFIGSIPLDAVLSLIACAFFLFGVYGNKFWPYFVSLAFTIGEHLMKAIIAMLLTLCLMLPVYGPMATADGQQVKLGFIHIILNLVNI